MRVTLLLASLCLTNGVKSVNKTPLKTPVKAPAPLSQLEADKVTQKYLYYIGRQNTASPIDSIDEMKVMRSFDVSRGDNFYTSTFPCLEKSRSDSVKTLNADLKIKTDETFEELMGMGYEKRLKATGRSDVSHVTQSAQKTAFHLELGKSKREQLIELRQDRLKERSGFVRLLPLAMHKYFDYLNSLAVKPSKKDLVKNLTMGAFFTFVVFANKALRTSFMYSIVANFIFISTMLTRNIPEQVVQPGMGRRRVGTWSGESFRTAVGITYFFYLTTALLSSSVLSVFPIAVNTKLKTTICLSVLSTSYFTAFYEVYEEKGKGGWRWKKSLEGTNLSDVDALIERTSKNSTMADVYDYAYDPMVEEFPPRQMYIGELPGQVPTPSSGDMDEGEWKDHYSAWKLERRDSRRAPITEVAPETPWVGGKVGAFVSKTPSWLGNAYKKSVESMNKWRGKKPKHKRDTSEFEPIEGTFAFRDKRPDWLDCFGSGVWEESGAASRSAARAFGTYRKTMWKIDPKIVLQKCDE